MASMHPGVLCWVLGSPDQLGADAKECSICFEEFIPGDQLSRLPCMHVLHRKCASAWFKIKRSCPLCKNPLA